MFKKDDVVKYYAGLNARTQVQCDRIIKSMSKRAQAKIQRLGKACVFPVFAPLALQKYNHGEWYLLFWNMFLEVVLEHVVQLTSFILFSLW